MLRWLAGLALAGVAAWVLAGQTGELSGAAGYLSHLRWWWLLPAVGAETVSYFSFAALQRVLLRSGGVATARAPMVGISLASNSLQNSLPAGTAFAAAFVYRQYRRLGADEVLAGWSVVAGVMLSFVAVAAMALVGLVLAFGAGSASDLVQAILWVAIGAGVVVLAWVERNRLFGWSVLPVRLVQRVAHRPKGDASEVVAAGRRRIGAVAPARREWLTAAVFAAGNWVFDCGCLTLGFLAVGAGVPWRGLLLAYAAAQLAAILPITPGGLGVVEGSMTIALVAFGGVQGPAVAAVLVYRLISFWAELPVGWAAFALVSRRDRRHAVVGARPGLPASVEVAGGEA